MIICVRTFVKLLAVFLLGVFSTACVAPSGFDQLAPTLQPEQIDSQKTYAQLVVGYSQIGAESEWRIGNTASIKEAAADLGVELLFSDGQQRQENQIRAIRTFIAQRVDVIGVSPVVETGWESVFQEAKDAGIPIILVDRRAVVSDDLYAVYLGSDFIEEGKNAGRVMVDLLEGEEEIIELVATVASAPGLDSYGGFREIIQDYTGM
ncbi:MAG: substrate-binding domain-containing protein, partial [Chloroflexota bacterium]